MSILTDLATAAGGLLVIGGGVGLVVLFGRDPKADEHDLADYHPRARTVDDGPARPAPVRPGSRASWPLVDRKPMPPRPALRPARAVTGPVGLAARQPAASADGPVPPLARALLIAQAVPTLPDAAVRGIADEWLREIAAEQQAAAGIRPGSEHWAQVDGSCWDDCPACARDLTGAFAVVRAA